MRKLAAMLAIAVLGLAACGDDDDGGGGSGGGGGLYGSGQRDTGGGSGGSTGGGGTQLTLVADPSGALKFDKKSLSADAGPLTVTLDNPSQVPHAVEVEGNGVEKASATIMQSKTKLELDLEAGEYEFYCPVGNHADAGMEGTLTIR